MKCCFCKADLTPSVYKSFKCPNKYCEANENDTMVALEIFLNGNYILPVVKSNKIKGWIEASIYINRLTFFFQKVGIDYKWRSHSMPYMQIQEDNDFDLIIEAVCKSVRKINIFK